MTYLMAVGAEIRRRREALGLTQVQLARLAGVTQPTISVIEGGKDTRLSTVGRLQEALSKQEAHLSGGRLSSQSQTVLNQEAA